MSIATKIGYALVFCASLPSLNASAATATYKGIVSAVIGSDTIRSARKDDGGTTLGPATYTVALGGATALSVSQSANGGSVYSEVTTVTGQANASTRLDYIGRLIGPNGPPVNVRVLASGFADGFGVNSSSSAFFTLEGTQDISGAFANLIGNASDHHGVGRDEFLINTIVKITPNIDFGVHILALASGGLPSDPSPSFAKAFVDPRFIVLNPLIAADYRFEGIPQAVPIPAAVLLFGPALLGLVRVRRIHSSFA